VGSMPLPANIVCITADSQPGVNCPLWPGGQPPLLPTCKKLEFRLSALMDSDLAWVNGKSAMLF